MEALVAAGANIKYAMAHAKASDDEGAQSRLTPYMHMAHQREL